MEIMGQSSQFSGRKLKPYLPNYETKVLSSHQQDSAKTR